MNIFLAILLNFVVSYTAYKKESLSYSGFIAALILGSSLYFFAGFFYWIIMCVFFISSSLLTKFKNYNKLYLEDMNEKGGKRDHFQVLANGGMGLFFSLLYFIYASPEYIIALVVAFAAANADTWASELGVLSKSNPISILNFKRTERGISGSISLLGTLASFFGALFIAIIFVTGLSIMNDYKDEIYKYILIVTLSGFLGSIIDSYLGALVQAKYKCTICNRITEKNIHHGKATVLERGIYFFNNDMVNLTSIMLASLISIFMFYNIM